MPLFSVALASFSIITYTMLTKIGFRTTVRVVLLLVNATVFLTHFAAAQNKDQDSEVYTREASLYQDLMVHRNYSKIFRPYNKGNATIVTLSIALTGVLKVDEKEGHLTTTFVPKMSWVDPRLQWKKADYPGLDYIQIPSTDLWIPDIQILNRYRELTHDPTSSTLVWVYWDGTVIYVPHQTYQTPCLFDLVEFPFDKHTCQVFLGSWAYMKDQVDILKQDAGTDLSFFGGSTDWHVLSLSMQRLETTYAGNTKPFVEILVNIKMERRTTFFYYMFLVPANILFFLLPLAHFLPPRKDGRFIIVSAIFVSTTLLLNTLEDILPAYYSEQPPRILRLYCWLMISALVSSLVSALCQTLSTTDTKSKKVPLILRKLFVSRFGRLLCLSAEGCKMDYDLLPLERTVLQDHTESGPEQELSNRGDNTDINSPDHEASSIASALQLLVGEMQLARHRKQLCAEWTLLAQVIDRIAALGFLLFAFAAICINSTG